ncbi:Hypothetical protein (Fragment) [Durusdinium trenchii]|uniref:Uncharacterized protein n=1 Tax=Durusdinium trenchii TaxID=1381693 RepID=A0ABP0JE26_9DINO
MFEDRPDRPTLCAPGEHWRGIRTPDAALRWHKVLRKHLGIAESQSCRSCLRRARCRYFKLPPEPEMQLGVRHIGRVLLGMAQYARAHLQFPDAYPWYFSDANLASARHLMQAIEEHTTKTEGVPFFYSDVELADEGTAREVLLREAQRKEEKRMGELEERLLSLPQWMRETLQPIPGPGMTARQRSILSEKGIKEVDAEDAYLDEEKPEKDWIEEGAQLGELHGSPLFDPLPDADASHASGKSSSLRPLVEVESVQEKPMVKRFVHLPGGPKEKPVSIVDARTGVPASGLWVGDEGHRIDLDDIEVDQEEMRKWEEIKPNAPNLEGKMDSLGVKLKGGYTLSELVVSSPGEAKHLVSISPCGLEGVHYYSCGVSPKIVHSESFEEVWKKGQLRNKKDELPFLRRIFFDTRQPHESGRAVPPPKLDEDLELEAVEETEVSEVFDTDAHLASEAVALRRAEAAALAEPEPASAPRLVPSHRSKTRGIGVFDPHLDLREAGDPERLERHHALPEESSGIYFRSSRPLPQDEDFVSTFRRPLKAEASSKDPLGAAAPQIDVAALKAMSEETVSSELPELGEIVFPSLPGAGAPPALRSRASPSGTRPAQRVRQLPLGTAKQARLKDDLSDLLKPGAPSSAAGALRQRLGMVTEKENPENPWQDLQRPNLKASELQEHRNSAMAAQRMLYKSLKQGNQKWRPKRAKCGSTGYGFVMPGDPPEQWRITFHKVQGRLNGVLDTRIPSAVPSACFGWRTDSTSGHPAVSLWFGLLQPISKDGILHHRVPVARGGAQAFVQRSDGGV